jgi:uncharacterized protein YebE (UPF0316 family)
MVWTILNNTLFIFGLCLIQVSIGAMRTIIMLRGKHIWAAMLGFVEVSLWLMAASQVIGHLDTIWNVLGYSGGYVMGTLLGMWLESRLALGHVNIYIVSLTRGLEIAQKIRQAGYGATQLSAEGLSGPVQLIGVVAARKQVADILRLVNEVDATSFVTVQEARQVIQGYPRLVHGW